MAERFDKAIQPPSDIIFVVETPAAGGPFLLPDGCRGLLVREAGVMEVTINGSAKSGIPFIAGTNPGRFTQIEANVANTALGIFAII